MSSLSIAKLLDLNYYRPFAVVLAPLIFLFGIFPANLQKVFTYFQYIGYVGIGIIIVYVIIYAIYMIKKGGN